MKTDIWTRAYIGTYTDEKLEGIHIVEANSATGAINLVAVVRGVENPTYLALSANRPLLYAVQGVPEYGARDCFGAVSVYGIDSGEPRLLGRRPVGVTVPCHIALGLGESVLAFAEYTNATAGVFKLDDNGLFVAEEPVVVQHHGSGPDRERQEAAHAHCATFTPDGRYLCVADLGIDRVVAYNMEGWGGGLKEVEALAISSAPGAGPRHLVFHPNGELAFLINELDNTLLALRYTASGFEELQRVSTVPVGFGDFSKAAALKFSDDGTRLLASNRGHDSIATFGVDPASGALELMAISPLAGSFPRDFAFFPGEKFIMVGHEKSGSVGVYAFDCTTGKLTYTGISYSAHRPVCTLFGGG